MKKYQPLKRKVEKIITKHPKYGYRRIKDGLRNRGIQVNAKPLRKLLNLWDLKLLRKVKKLKPSGIESILREAGNKANLVKQLSPPILPFQVIYTDFTEIRCLAGIFKFIPFVVVRSFRAHPSDFVDDDTQRISRLDKIKITQNY